MACGGLCISINLEFLDCGTAGGAESIAPNPEMKEVGLGFPIFLLQGRHDWPDLLTSKDPATLALLKNSGSDRGSDNL